jgi:hypothetical protein
MSIQVNVAVLGAALLAAVPAAAVEIIPVSEIRPGMEGYGLSVFQGTKIERFQVKVIGVLRNFAPKMDIILIRCSGANLEYTGVVAGMSGSPIYLGPPGKERMAGALAYGWQFSKDPVAGVTPIQAMLDEAKRPLRRSLRDAVSLLDHPQLKPAAAPLLVNGAVGRMLKALEPEFERWHLLPLQGGGAGPVLSSGEKVELEPGAALGVQLMRGDLEMTAVGTVTYREKDTVLAFGHPMLGIGELEFPIATAYVHHTFAGVARSFKMAGAIAPVGTLVQDRQPAVVGKVGALPPLIPIRIEVHNPMARRDDVFQMEVAHHRRFTPILALIAMLNSVLISASDATDVSFEARLKLKLAGHEPIEFCDHVFSTTGLLGAGLFSSPVFQALSQLYGNTFEEVRAERVDYSVRLLFKRDLVQLESVRFHREALVPGEKARATVRLRPYLGRPYERQVEFPVPESLEGQTVNLQFAGGPSAILDLAPPDRFSDLVRNLGKRHPPKSVVVTLYMPSQSFKYRGQMLPDLPPSAIHTLSSSNTAGEGMVGAGLSQTVVPMEHIVVGAHQVRIRVKGLLE